MDLLRAVGRVGQHRLVIDQVPTVGTNIYAVGNAMGGLLTFAHAAFPRGLTGMIEALRIVDRANQAAAIDLVLFDQSFTVTNDHSAFDPSDADLENCIGVISVAAADYVQFNDNAVATVRSIDLPFSVVGGHSIYGQLIAQDTPTYDAASDLRLRMYVRRD